MGTSPAINKEHSIDFPASVGVALPPPTAMPFSHAPTSVGFDPCGSFLSARELSEVKQLIANTPIIIFALQQPMQCTIAAMDALNARSVCYTVQRFTDTQYQFGNDATISAPMWQYMKCKMPTRDMQVEMHSYGFIGGEGVGHGFNLARLPDLDSRIAAAGAPRDCVNGQPRTPLTPAPVMPTQPPTGAPVVTTPAPVSPTSNPSQTPSLPKPSTPSSEYTRSPAFPTVSPTAFPEAVPKPDPTTAPLLDQNVEPHLRSLLCLHKECGPQVLQHQL